MTTPRLSLGTSFPLGWAAALATGTAGLSLAAGLGLIRAVCDSQPGMYHAAALVTALVWVLGIAGLTLVAIFGPWGVMPTVAAYFAGAGLRMAVILVALAAVLVGDLLPAGPVLISLAAAYLPMLALDAALVGRYLWRKDALPAAPQRVPAATTVAKEMPA